MNVKLLSLRECNFIVLGFSVVQYFDIWKGNI